MLGLEPNIWMSKELFNESCDSCHVFFFPVFFICVISIFIYMVIITVVVNLSVSAYVLVCKGMIVEVGLFLFAPGCSIFTHARSQGTMRTRILFAQHGLGDKSLGASARTRPSSGGSRFEPSFSSTPSRTSLIGLSISSAASDRDCLAFWTTSSAVVGANGGGESTVLRAFAGEQLPSECSVLKDPGFHRAHVAQHAFHHLEKHMISTPTQCSRWLRGRDDGESLEFKSEELSVAEAVARDRPWCIDIVTGDSSQDLLLTVSFIGVIVMLIHFVIIVAITVFNTTISASVLVCQQIVAWVRLSSSLWNSISP